MSRNPTSQRRQPARRAFSLVEMLIALTITATLLTATMAALDASFKSYKVTTEGASTNVVARMVMHRLMTMVRTGDNFGPYPVDPLATPILESDFVEFQTKNDPIADTSTFVKIERRAQTDPERGPFELWYIQTQYSAGALQTTEARPLITGVLEAKFTLEYDVGPRLRRATVDLTIRPNSFQAASIGIDFETPTIRLVSSVVPRRLD